MLTRAAFWASAYRAFIAWFCTTTPASVRTSSGGTTLVWTLRIAKVAVPITATWPMDSVQLFLARRRTPRV